MMKIKVVGSLVGLLLAGAPALAQDAKPAKPFATPAATATEHGAPAKKPAAKKPRLAATAATAPAADEATGTVTRRKGRASAKGAHAAAVPPAYAALPEAERLAIQADLAWLGDFDATEIKDFDERTVAAIKAFQQRRGGKPTGVLNGEERAALAAAAAAPEAAVGWQVLDDAATGARLSLPTKLVPQSSAARTGSRWMSPHGQIQVETLRLHEASLPALFDDEKKTPRTRRVEWSEIKPDSFVLAGMQGLKKFRVRVEARGSELRGVTVLYDQATEGIMAPVALAMSSAFRGFPDAGTAPPPGRKRGVEYATAIVVSSRGDLLTLAQVTDECQSISVPGLGHAERIATDKAADLALLRLYGAQNLSAAALGGDTGKTGDLTLVGIADPLAQAGGDAVTSAPAHGTAQGIEPAPQLGFAGAAAVDAQGRFAGVVEPNAPVVAGIDAAARQATLVPAEAVRAFLAAQGIAPAAAPAAMARSVLRVICVRK